MSECERCKRIDAMLGEYDKACDLLKREVWFWKTMSVGDVIKTLREFVERVRGA